MPNLPPDEIWGKHPGPFVPFDWRAFTKKYLTLNPAHRGSFKSCLFHLMLYAFGQTGWLADDLFYRGWRDKKLQGPLFILGHQRSGTTYLHRLLALDNHFYPLKLHEMLFPSISIQRIIGLSANWDDRFGGRIAKALNRQQDRLFGELDQIHRIRFNEIEEDEFVLWGILSSGMCATDSLHSAANPHLVYLRQFEKWTLRRQSTVLNWYRACLVKKIFRESKSNSGEKMWPLSKNPAFGQKISWLLKVFPDSRYIYLIRNPLETIPSRLSLIQAILNLRSDGLKLLEKSFVDALVQDSIRTYLIAEQDLVKVPPGRQITVAYDRLCKAPKDCVEEIYQKLDLKGPVEMLLEKIDESSQFSISKTGRKYSLEQFGLDKAELVDRLSIIFKRYGFSTD
jgi:hypothetical protein